MSLAAGVASVNSLAEEGLELRTGAKGVNATINSGILNSVSQSEHIPTTADNGENTAIGIRHQRVEKVSVTGAQLDLQWRQLANVEYLTDGGNSWIHTAVFNGRPIVVKTLKPECQDVALAINEIESELAVHSRLNHVNIVSLIGAGTTSKGVRFFVLERLDGGTLTQMLGYDTRIRDRRRRFWRRKQFSFLDTLRIAKAMAEAMSYCHESAIPGCVVLHRDLKPDNIGTFSVKMLYVFSILRAYICGLRKSGFTLDGTVKILDFGLAKIMENANVDSDDVYAMSGETGSLRYMAPEVASGEPYNYSADVYSFGIILWELNSMKKPFEGLNRDLFYERVVHGGERPPLSRKWPTELGSLMSRCWDADLHNRPKFRDIVVRLDALLESEKGGTASAKKKTFLPKISGMIDRHSTWF